MAERVMTAHVPEALAREVDNLAEKLDRPRGWILKEALSRFVELERKRDDLTKEALAEVDSGDLVDHGDVETWAAKATRKQSELDPNRRGEAHAPPSN